VLGTAAVFPQENRKGDEKMKFYKEGKRQGCFLAGILAAAMFLGGCAATINYSYDPAADFSSGKNYSWEPDMMYSGYTSTLVEKNVRFYADQSLRDKGFIPNTDKPDFWISMNYQTEYSNPYKLSILNLYVSRPQGKGRLWQGTANGTINADGASYELAEAVKNILTNFPPSGNK
jgi:hypothetical protein